MELESGCEISFKILFSNFEMKKIFGIIMTAVMLGSCNSNSVFVPEEVTDADLTQICRVEPLSWWVGMNTPLQLLIQGEGISEYDVVFEGGNGVKVSGVHKADSPNYLFVDVAISANAQPGTYYLVFTKGEESFKRAYEIGARVECGYDLSHYAGPLCKWRPV